MRGMNQKTGKFIADLEHLTQSIKLILNTPIGSRVMLPEFGSEVIDLIDTPMTPSNQLRLYAATHEAIARWEPRIDVQQVKLQKISEIVLPKGHASRQDDFRNAHGVVTFSITGIYDEHLITIDTLQIGRGV